MTDRPTNVPEHAVWSAAQRAWITGDTATGGLVAYYRPDGSPWCEYTYDGGVLHGPYRRFHETGEVASQGQMERGRFAGANAILRPSGPSTEPFPNPFGDLVHRIETDYNAGQPVGQRFYDAAGTELDPAVLMQALATANPHVARALGQDEDEDSDDDDAEDDDDDGDDDEDEDEDDGDDDAAVAAAPPARPAEVPVHAEYKDDYWRVEREVDGLRHVTRWSPDGTRITESIWAGEVLRTYTTLRPDGSRSSHLEVSNGVTHHVATYPDGTPWHTSRYIEPAADADDDDAAPILIEQQLYLRDGTLKHHIRQELDDQRTVIAHREDGPGGVPRFENTVVDGVRQLRFYDASGAPDYTIRLTEPVVVVAHAAQDRAIELTGVSGPWSASTCLANDEAFAVGREVFARVVPTLVEPPAITALAARLPSINDELEGAPFSPATIRHCLIAVTSPIALVALVGKMGLGGGLQDAQVDAVVETLLALARTSPAPAAIHGALQRVLGTKPVGLATLQQVLASPLPPPVLGIAYLSLADSEPERPVFEAAMAVSDPALRLVAIRAAAIVHGASARSWLEPALCALPPALELAPLYAALAIDPLEQCLAVIGSYLESAVAVKSIVALAAAQPAVLTHDIIESLTSLLRTPDAGASPADAAGFLRALAAGPGKEIAAPVAKGLPAGAERLTALASRVEREGVGVLATLQPVIGSLALPSGTLVLADFKCLGAVNPWAGTGEKARAAIAQARAAGETQVDVHTHHTSADCLLDLPKRAQCDVVATLDADGDLTAVSVLLSDAPPVGRTKVGVCGAEGGRVMFADSDSLSHFTPGDTSRDGRMDVVFFGPNAPDLAAELGVSPAYPNQDTKAYRGWTDLGPGDLYTPLLTAVEQGRVSVEHRPHNDQYRLLRTMWSSPVGAVTTTLGGFEVFGIFTPHRGNYDIVRETAADGSPCRITLVLARESGGEDDDEDEDDDDDDDEDDDDEDEDEDE